MGTRYTLTLSGADVLQILDALDSRAASYEFTARYLRGGEEATQLIEDVADAEEAEAIARHFRDIQEILTAQITAQRQAQQGY